MDRGNISMVMKKIFSISMQNKKLNSTSPSLFGLLRRYAGIIILLVVLTIVANALSVAVPK